MPAIDGIIVDVATDDSPGARDPGTDDQVYVGIVGRGGGSEFALDVRSEDDFEAGDHVCYFLGYLSDPGAAAACARSRVPFESNPPHPGSTSSLGHGNCPEFRNIDINMVDYVYVRKQGRPGRDADDNWRMAAVEVTLYAEHGRFRRVFAKREPITLGNEYGLTVWLIQTQ